MLCARRSTRSCVVFLLSHDLSQVHQKGHLGDEVDGMQRERRCRLQRVPEAFERCRCACDVHSGFLCTFFEFTLLSQVRLVYLIFAVPRTLLEKQILLCFDRAGDRTGGVKDDKGLWLACQSTGNNTGGRAHGPTAMLCFFLFEQLDVCSLPIIETQIYRRNVSGVDRRETGFSSLSGILASLTTACFMCATHLRNVVFIGAPGVPDLRSAADPT